MANINALQPMSMNSFWNFWFWWISLVQFTTYFSSWPMATRNGWVSEEQPI